MIIDLQNGTVTKIFVREKIGAGKQFFHENWSHDENFGPWTKFSRKIGRPLKILFPHRQGFWLEPCLLWTPPSKFPLLL